MVAKWKLSRIHDLLEHATSPWPHITVEKLLLSRPDYELLQIIILGTAVSERAFEEKPTSRRLSSHWSAKYNPPAFFQK